MFRLPSVPPDRRLPYGPDPQQFGDLYLPQGAGPHPVVVLLHGGCWRAEYGLEHLGQFCEALKKEGLAVWNLEYRRLGSGGGWTATFEDAARGVDFLQDLADRYPLNLSRVIYAGHSAGGHLALWLAGRHHLPAESPLYPIKPLVVKGVVSLAGIPDLVEGVKRDICAGACRELVGGLPDEVPQRYRQGSPIALLPLGVPQWHLVGLLDRIVPADYVGQYVALAEKQDRVNLDLLPDAGHFELIVPATPAWAFVRQAVLTLLQEKNEAIIKTDPNVVT
ncbi:MAG: alpha/beta hydrolase [Deltaproteobacteria bacterium]|nr:alpha/beta hydrolase [Deltaproteobacteria bacterium]